MDVDLIRTFLAVAQSGSFAASARTEGVDPSSVSRRVAALEDALGLRLFERTTRRLSLTEAGRLYAAEAAPALEALDTAHARATDALTAPSGLLRVTASVAFGTHWLTPRLAAFRAAYPDVEVELILSDAQLDIAATGIDLAVRLGPRPSGALVISRLMSTPYRLVAAPGHPELPTPADLARHICLPYALPGLAVWRLRHAGQTTEHRAEGPLRISSAVALRRAALDGQGIALLADWLVAEDLAAGRLVSLLPDCEATPSDWDTAAWITYPSRAYVPARLRAFIDHLRSA